MASNGIISKNPNENAGFIKPLYQLGTLWEVHNNEQSRRKLSKMNQQIGYFNNMSKRTWNRAKINVPENIEEEKETKDVESDIEKNKKILQLLSHCGYEIGQVNGQRRLGPLPGWTGPPPHPKCEVFVGKIPRDLYEDEIFPVFSKIGEIYEIRLMMDFSGNNRGYCFVKYTKPEDAKKAIAELDNYEIRPGNVIGVVPSINNCRLSVSHLPPNLNVEAFIKKVYEITKDVANVSVYRHRDGRVKNAIILYNTHIGAAMARRKLVPDKNTFLEGSELTVDWACPKASYQNVIQECGVVGKNGQVEITKTVLYTNKNCRRISYRSESSNGDGSSGLGDKEAFENKEDSGRSSRNSVRNNFSGHQKSDKFVNYRNPSNKQRAMSESDLFRGDLNLSLRPISKQLMPSKMRGSQNNLNHFHKSNLINKNSRNYKSNLDLSKSNFNHKNYPETVNSLNRAFMKQENNKNTARNYKQPMYLSNSAISASSQNLYVNNNRIGSSSMMNLNTKNSQKDRFNRNKYSSVENISSLFNNLGSEPNYAGKSFLNAIAYNGLNYNNSLMSNGNNVYDCMTNGNSYSQPNFFNSTLKIGQQDNFQNMNKPMQFEVPNTSASFINYNQIPNYYPGVVNNGQYYNVIPMPSDSGVFFNDNYNENNQNFLNNINVTEPFCNFCNNENTQKITLNNMGVACVPKFDTKAFGLGKMQPNSFQQQYPRPILSRSLSENMK